MRTRLKTLAILLCFAAPSAGVVLAGPADAAEAELRIERVVEVDSIKQLKGHKIRVTLTNGRNRTLLPCKYEDSPRCYWKADSRGNKRGNSFVSVFGRTFYVDLSHLR